MKISDTVLEVTGNSYLARRVEMLEDDVILKTSSINFLKRSNAKLNQEIDDLHGQIIDYLDSLLLADDDQFYLDEFIEVFGEKWLKVVEGSNQTND